MALWTSLGELSFARREGGAIVEYGGTMVSPKDAVLHALAELLRRLDRVVEYDLDRISK